MALNPAANGLFISLLQGTYDATTLQTLLGTASNKGAFVELMNDRATTAALFSEDASADAILGSALAYGAMSKSSVALSTIAANAYSTYKLCQFGAALAEIFDPIFPERFDHWRLVDRNYRNIQSQVNASGSKLRRQIIEANSGSVVSGTWTKPATLYRFSYSLIGGGAGAYGGFSSSGGGAGGGGAMVVGNASALPANNVSYSIGTYGSGGFGNSFGSDGSDSTLNDGASFSLIAQGGNRGSNTSGGSQTSGSSSGDYSIIQRVTDINFFDAVWQMNNVTIEGGRGGNGGSQTPGYGVCKAMPFLGGPPGIYYFDGTNYQGGQGSAGLFPTAAGAGGIYIPSGSNYSLIANPNQSGNNLRDKYGRYIPGVGGGGAYSISVGINYSGGAGSGGLGVLHWIEG